MQPAQVAVLERLELGDGPAEPVVDGEQIEPERLAFLPQHTPDVGRRGRRRRAVGVLAVGGRAGASIPRHSVDPWSSSVRRVVSRVCRPGRCPEPSRRSTPPSLPDGRADGVDEDGGSLVAGDGQPHLVHHIAEADPRRRMGEAEGAARSEVAETAGAEEGSEG